jgi:hypothetical protein
MNETEKGDLIASLFAEIDRLKAISEKRFEELNLVSFLNGKFEFEGAVIGLIAEYLAQMPESQRKADPANYVEMEISHARLGPLTLSLQRQTGKTPHQLRKAVEGRNADLIAEVSSILRQAEGGLAVLKTCLDEGTMSDETYAAKEDIYALFKGLLSKTIDKQGEATVCLEG